MGEKRANNRETVFPKFRKSTRHRSERSNRRKNSTSPGKEAGVLEWVCNFRAESMDFVPLRGNKVRDRNPSCVNP